MIWQTNPNARMKNSEVFELHPNTLFSPTLSSIPKEQSPNQDTWSQDLTGANPDLIGRSFRLDKAGLQKRTSFKAVLRTAGTVLEPNVPPVSQS